MILNFNITGKETDMQLAKIVAETLQTMQDDIDTSNGTVSRTTQLVYYAVSVGLISSFFINEAYNELLQKHNGDWSKIDRRSVKELISSAMTPKLVDDVMLKVNWMIMEISQNQAIIHTPK